MRPFSALYERTLRLAAHRRAPWWLGGLSFAESSFFPIPPDVMLAPMALAKPERAWFYATLTTVTSVLGGLLGYWIGSVAFDAIAPYLEHWGYGARYATVTQWVQAYGVWIIFIVGFSPIPYKLFTVAAGALAMPLLPFALASVVGRGGRFFLVAGLIRWGGAAMEAAIRRHVDTLGWLVVAAIAVFGAVRFL